MQKLSFDTGVQEYSVNGTGTLRFNPTDPGLYTRFMEFHEALHRVLDEYRSKTTQNKGKAEEVLAAAAQADQDVKRGLAQVFGAGNDFEEILQGVNVLAITDSGATVAENLLEALLPVIEKSAVARKKALDKKAQGEVDKARARRARLET